jgi:hypothetical protein
MIERAAAIRIAISIMRTPSRVRQVRWEPLPEGVNLLLRIAAGDRAAEHEAAALTGEPPAVLHDAAIFFIQQILLSPDADCYRVLGAAPGAAGTELRGNMALLLRGMHPDIQDGLQSVFAHRVISAWDALKTPERRSAYDATLQKSCGGNRLSKNRRARQRSNKHWLPRQLTHRISHQTDTNRRVVRRTTPEGLLHRLLRMLLTGVRA